MSFSNHNTEKPKRHDGAPPHGEENFLNPYNFTDQDIEILWEDSVLGAAARELLINAIEKQNLPLAVILRSKFNERSQSNWDRTVMEIAAIIFAARLLVESMNNPHLVTIIALLIVSSAIWSKALKELHHQPGTLDDTEMINKLITKSDLSSDAQQFLLDYLSGQEPKQETR